MTLLTGKPIAQVVPPALPQSTEEYSVQWQDAYNNILRLYFNRINNVTNGILSTDSGGASLFNPHISYYSEVTQTATAIDTAKLIEFDTASPDTTQLGLTVGGVNNTDITALYTGVYSLNVVLQGFSNASSTRRITVWLRRNSVDVPFSSQTITVAKTGFDQVVYNQNIELKADDTLQVVWAVTDLGLELRAVAAVAPYPAVPSARLNMLHVSNTLLET